jgi:tetratricopeptide (TPR) repeat protein
MKKLLVLIALLPLSVYLIAQEQLAQLSNAPSLSLYKLSAATLGASDQLFSDATGLMFSGQNAEAFTTFMKAAESFKSENRFHEWSGCYAGIAIVLTSEGKYRKLLRMSKKALRVHNKYNAQDVDAGETLISNVGIGYQLIGNTKKAAKYWSGIKKSN